MSLLLAVVVALQQPAVTAAPGEPTDKTWTVVGKAGVADETVMHAAARRIERRWDAAEGKFYEVASDAVRRCGSAVVQKGAFSARLKPAPAGLYQLAVRDEDRPLFETRTPFGRIGRLFASSRGMAEKLVGVADKAQEFLDEVSRITAGTKAPTTRMFEDFQSRIARQESVLEEAATATDLTASVEFLKDVYYHLRNAQVWSRDDADPADNDLTAQGSLFLDPDLTLAALGKRIQSARGVIAAEILLSIATLLDGMAARAQTEAGEVARAREAVREAAKLAHSAPSADEEFAAAIEKAARGDEWAALRQVLEVAIAERLKR